MTWAMLDPPWDMDYPELPDMSHEENRASDVLCQECGYLHKQVARQLTCQCGHKVEPMTDSSMEDEMDEQEFEVTVEMKVRVRLEVPEDELPESEEELRELIACNGVMTAEDNYDGAVQSSEALDWRRIG